jgi:hypothetical protein
VDFFENPKVNNYIQSFEILPGPEFLNLHFYTLPEVIDGLAKKQHDKIEELKIEFLAGDGAPMSLVLLKNLYHRRLVAPLAFDYATTDISILTIGFTYEEAYLYGTQAENGPVDLPLRI